MIVTSVNMGNLAIDDILKATGGRLLFGKDREVSGLSIDSRTIQPGEIFVALKGDRFDGHDFVADALLEGSGAIVSMPPLVPQKGKTLIYVNNTLQALHDIARYVRFRLNVPVIGVTGTNGKTTTKELIASILGVQGKVLKTAGNLNNHIGMPLSITKTDWDEDVMVLEMGSNAPGDISMLCSIAAPDYGVVTNVGPAHLEGFGSLEMIRNTDLEILESAGTVAVNADDLFLMEGMSGYEGKVITYGIQNPSDITARNILLGERSSSFELCFPDGRALSINLAVPGRFNVNNALAAAAIAHYYGASDEEIRIGLEGFRGVTMRLEIKELFGALVISDVYNANPTSMEEAVKELIRLRRKRTVAVLGDMLELGAYTKAAHRKLVQWLSEMQIDVLIAVGPEMTEASDEFSGRRYTAVDSKEARGLLLDICSEGDTILVKGSRGMQMEKVLGNNGHKAERHGL